MWGVNTRCDTKNRVIPIVTQWLHILPENSPGNLSETAAILSAGHHTFFIKKGIMVVRRSVVPFRNEL